MPDKTTAMVGATPRDVTMQYMWLPGLSDNADIGVDLGTRLMNGRVTLPPRDWDCAKGRAELPEGSGHPDGLPMSAEGIPWYVSGAREGSDRRRNSLPARGRDRGLVERRARLP